MKFMNKSSPPHDPSLYIWVFSVVFFSHLKSKNPGVVSIVERIRRISNIGSYTQWWGGRDFFGFSIIIAKARSIVFEKIKCRLLFL